MENLYRDAVEVDTEGGVLVDQNMVTSDLDIYAQWDICSTSWEPSEHLMKLQIFSTFIPDPVGRHQEYRAL